MTALTFDQALAKYRPDQARDRRGRWTEDRSHGDFATEWRAELKPRMGVAGRKRLLERVRHSILMARQGDIAGRVAGGKAPVWRENQIADLKRFARELAESIKHLQAKGKSTGQMSEQARELHDRINALNGQELSDAKINAYKAALAELKGMRLSRTEAHTFARLMGVEFAPKSTTGKWAKERAESEMFDQLRYLRYLRGKGQTP